MTISKRLWFGPAAAAIFAVGIVGLSLMVPGYSQVRQTVSEIGEVGSPARLPFAIMLCCVGALLLLRISGRQPVPAPRTLAHRRLDHRIHGRALHWHWHLRVSPSAA